MKKTSLLLLIFVSLTAFTCENESLDFEVESVANTNTTTNPASLVGTWQAVSLDADTQSSIDFAGIVTQSVSTIDGVNLDYRVTFTDNGTFTTEGNYDLNISVSGDGIPTNTQTFSLTNLDGSGTYQITGPNMITISNSFYDLQIDGMGQTTGQDVPSESEYSISPDGQTLTFVQNETQTQSELGIDITTTISAISVFTRL